MESTPAEPSREVRRANERKANKRIKSAIKQFSQSGLDSRRVSDVPSEKITWEWEERIARKKLTFIVGDPGETKSILTLEIAARVSTGRDWPDDSKGEKPGSVIILTGEDDVGDTIRPRLEAAGADLNKIHVISMVKDSAAGKSKSVEIDGKVFTSSIKLQGIEREFDLASDMPRLAKLMEEIGDVRMVLVDPITAYQGTIDSNQANQVRHSLLGLQRLAKKHRVAVVGVIHLNKDSAMSPIHRISGSMAYMAVARCVFLVKRLSDGTTYGMLSLKSNITKSSASGLTYTIEEVITTKGIKAPRIVWGAKTPLTAAQALSPTIRTGESRERAVKFLKAVLAKGPRSPQEVESLRLISDISANAFKEAKKEVGVVFTPDNRFAGSGFWSLPGPPGPRTASAKKPAPGSTYGSNNGTKPKE